MTRRRPSTSSGGRGGATGRPSTCCSSGCSRGSAGGRGDDCRVGLAASSMPAISCRTFCCTCFGHEAGVDEQRRVQGLPPAVRRSPHPGRRCAASGGAIPGAVWKRRTFPPPPVPLPCSSSSTTKPGTVTCAPGSALTPRERRLIVGRAGYSFKGASSARSPEPVNGCCPVPG